MLDKYKEIVDISASCFTLLDIRLHELIKKKAKFDIAILLPTLFGANYYQFVNKAGCQIEYLFPEFQPINENKTSDFMETNDPRAGSLNNVESDKMPNEEEGE